jgi:hypothetical protein
MNVTRSVKTCDTHDMVVVHSVFRREFAQLPSMVRAVTANDTARSALIAEHAREMIDVLRHHHEVEDELLWPRLRARSDLDREVIFEGADESERVRFLQHVPVPARVGFSSSVAVATPGRQQPNGAISPRWHRGRFSPSNHETVVDSTPPTESSMDS